MNGASAAGLFDPAAKRRPGPMDANGGIFRGDP